MAIKRPDMHVDTIASMPSAPEEDCLFGRHRPERKMRCIVIILGLFVWVWGAALCLADNAIYQYKDDDGVRRFSDRLPITDQPVERHAGVSAALSQPQVFIEAEDRGDSTRLVVVNTFPATVTVEISFASLENMVSTPPLPHRFVVTEQDRQAVVSLQKVDPALKWAYRYRYNYCLGPPDAVHRPAVPYRLPFNPKRSFKVSQAFNGDFSHQEEHSRYAVDISMPLGTPILCTREGMVVAVEENNVWGGDSKAYFLDRINSIRIIHDDGTMALYGHIRRGASRVQPGDRVAAGQVIAESGNTGYSSGPHLHFVVQRNMDLRYEAIPFQFQDADIRGITPVKGMMLGGR